LNTNEPKKTDEPNVGRQIRAPKVRVISDEGEQVGILDLRDALAMADEKGLDLVEVSPQARPPVCKLMDWGKFKYALKKKAGEQKKKTHQMQIKEIKMRPKTDEHDLTTKTRHAREFLEEGHGVKLTLRFRGREIIYAEGAMEQLFKVANDISDLGTIKSHPSLEGRAMSMVILPKKN